MEVIIGMVIGCAGMVVGCVALSRMLFGERVAAETKVIVQKYMMQDGVLVEI